MKISRLSSPARFRLLAGLLLLASLASPGFGAESPAELAAIADLQEWATTKLANGPAGRPLPVAGSWNNGTYTYRRYVNDGAVATDTPHGVVLGPIDSEWSPNYIIGLIKQGKRVIPAFGDPAYLQVSQTDPATEFVDRYFRPALEYARDHRLPLSFTGGNWEDFVRDLSPDSGSNTARVLRNGQPTNEVDPIGPIANWQNAGTYWMNSAIMQAIQEIYPDPPLVIFLGNNEGSKLGYPGDWGTDADRFNALYPSGTTDATKARVIREGYTARYAALFTAARAAVTKTAWRTNIRFVAYNAWGDPIMGRGAYNPVADGTDVWFDPAPDKGYRFWSLFDGAMPEYYDNQWQGEKTDFSPWCPQLESFNYTALQDMIFAERPDYYFSMITWEGGRGSQFGTKVFNYITGGFGAEAQHWDAARYQGFHQFGLWATRPRDYREFRGYEKRDGYNQSTWDSVVASTEQVWNNPALRDYWRFGKLVQNADGATRLNGHYFANTPAWPQWLKDTPRWFLLKSSVNADDTTWPVYYDAPYSAHLRVMSLALALDSAPNRRWLIYAYGPLGGVAGSQVTLPGYGSVTLDYVSRSGSFFELRENGRTVTSLIRGGSPEISVTASKRRVAAGESFTVAAAVTMPFDTPFTTFNWTTGEDATVTQTNLAGRTLSFTTAGEHFITVEGVTADGHRVTGQTVVYVGPAPDDSVAYQLSFDRAYDAESLWDGTLDPVYNAQSVWDSSLATPITYRLMPNAAATDRVDVPVHGGAFVNDAQRGAVYELSSPGAGANLRLSDRTTYSENGLSNLTIDFWFKPAGTTGLQGLFAQGYDAGGGFTIYLDGDRLYAGSWAINNRLDPGPGVAAEDAIWDGNWLSTAPGAIVAGEWYHVRLLLKDATDKIAPKKLFLYLNGNLVQSGPGVRVKRHWTPPRLGFLGDARIHRTRTSSEADQFYGRLDDFTYATAVAQSGANGTLLRAINAAGPALLGSTGLNYEADTGFSGGTVRTVSNTAPITGPDDGDVYRTARQGAAFSYALPAPAGIYRVKLKFAELDYQSAGLRRFGISAEGQAKITGLDLFQTAGYGAGYDAEFTVIVNDGTLNLAFSATVGQATVAAIQVWDVTPPAATTVAVGSTADPFATDSVSDSSGNGYINGSRFIATATNSVDTVKAFVSAITNSYQCAIYADAGGNPAGLLRATQTRLGVPAGWQSFALTSPLQITAGTAYWLVIWSNDSAAGIGYTAGGETRWAQYPFGSFPASLSLAHPWSATYCIYAEGASALTALQTWRQTNFGTSANLSNAADTADPDGDGMVNLLEYALGGNPTNATSSPLPTASTDANGKLRLTFTRARSDVTYTVQANSDLLTWSDLAVNPGAVGQSVTVTDAPPPNAIKRFLRLKVIAP